MHFSTAHFSTAHFWEIQRWNIDFLTFVPRGQIWTMSHVFDLRTLGQNFRLDFKKLDSSTFDFSTLDFLKIGFRKFDFSKNAPRPESCASFFLKKKTCFEFWHSFCRQSSSSSSSSLARGPPPPPAMPTWSWGLRGGAPGARGGGADDDHIHFGSLPYPLTPCPYYDPSKHRLLWPSWFLYVFFFFNDSCTLII